MSKSKKTSYIPGLDLLRFLAAAFVVFYHFGFWIWAGDGQSITYRWPSSITWFGSVGVEVFFTLSGFVIAYTAVDATGLSFTRSRLARLVPGSLICATLTLFTCFVLHAGTPSGLMLEWLHSAFLPLRAPFIDSSYWTLPVEITFYVLVLLLILLKHEWLLPKVIGAVGAASSGSWLLLSAFSLFQPDKPLIGRFSAHALIYLMNTRQVFFFTLLPHGCLFAEGVLLWFCLTHRPTRNRVVMLILCTLGGLAETFWHAQLELESVRAIHPEAITWTSHALVPCIAWLMSVALIVQSVRKNDWVCSAFAPLLPLIRWAGLLTYPLYLLHQRMGYLLIERLRTRFTDNQSLLIVTIGVFVMAMSIAMYGEPPLRRWIQQRMGAPVKS